jgi:predicted transcriptional regulator
VKRTHGRFDAFMARGSRSGGFTRVPNILLRRSESLGLDRSSLAVLVVLLSLRRGDVSCVSVARIARDANLSERTVKTCVSRMDTAGIIAIKRDPYRYRRRRSNTYDLRPLVDLMERSVREQPWAKHAQADQPSAMPVTENCTDPTS